MGCTTVYNPILIMKVSALVEGEFLCVAGVGNYRLTAENRPDWLRYLETHSSFRYEASPNSPIRFSAVKDSHGYWTAKKKVNGKLRQKRLGNSVALSKRPPDDLYQIALGLSEISAIQPVRSTNALRLIETEMAKLEPRKTSERVKLAWQVLVRLKQELSDGETSS